MEVPSFSFRDGKLVPGQKDYVLTTDFHLLPKKQMFQNNVQTTQLDGSYDELSWDEIYPIAGESIRLTLNRIKERNGFDRIKTITLKGVKKMNMQFSRSGKYFAIYNQDDFKLEVYDSSNITQCFECIENQQPIMKLKFDDIKFKAKKLVFDLRDNYMAIYSEA